MSFSDWVSLALYFFGVFSVIAVPVVLWWPQRPEAPSPSVVRAPGDALEKRYGAVRLFCEIEQFFGILFIIAAFVLAYIGFSEATPKIGKPDTDLVAVFFLGAGFSLVIALIQFASSQMKKVFLDQEEHLRAMREILREALVAKSKGA